MAGVLHYFISIHSSAVCIYSTWSDNTIIHDISIGTMAHRGSGGTCPHYLAAVGAVSPFSSLNTSKDKLDINKLVDTFI